MPPQTKTAKPFSMAEREKRFPLKGLASMFSDKPTPKPSAKPVQEMPETEEDTEMDHMSMAEQSLDDATAAIESGDTEAALAAISEAKDYLAQCKSEDEQAA